MDFLKQFRATCGNAQFNASSADLQVDLPTLLSNWLRNVDSLAFLTPLILALTPAGVLSCPLWPIFNPSPLSDRFDHHWRIMSFVDALPPFPKNCEGRFMKVSVVKETFPGERRVALIPASVGKLMKSGCEVLVETGAGELAGFSDDAFRAAGAMIAGSRDEAFAADVILQVRTLGANQEHGADDLSRLSAGKILIGTADPLGAPEAALRIAETGARLFALELIPRITRAQTMDILSSMATISGYRAVLLAAVELPKMFPLMMTAAGTLSAARTFVIGAGVAGLQAIATARRLGAIVRAYDVRAACREQVESLGAKFVELELPSDDAEGQGGYAKAMDEEFYRRQRELMASVVAESDIVITTAAIPGRPSPLLITREAVEGMQAGGVIVDLAAERGGNCEVSQADQRVEHHGVVILGPTNLPAEVPLHASQMFSNNVTKFLLNMIVDGKLEVDLTDEIIRDTLVTDHGDVVHERLRSILKLPPLPPPPRQAEPESEPERESNGEEEPEVSSPVAHGSDERLDVGDLTDTAQERDNDQSIEVAEDAESDNTSDEDESPGSAGDPTEQKH
jgi:NAD(P) transhydrogenase subunit alpha